MSTICWKGEIFLHGNESSWLMWLWWTVYCFQFSLHDVLCCLTVLLIGVVIKLACNVVCYMFNFTYIILLAYCVSIIFHKKKKKHHGFRVRARSPKKHVLVWSTTLSGSMVSMPCQEGHHIQDVGETSWSTHGSKQTEKQKGWRQGISFQETILSDLLPPLSTTS